MFAVHGIRLWIKTAVRNIQERRNTHSVYRSDRKSFHCKSYGEMIPSVKFIVISDVPDGSRL